MAAGTATAGSTTAPGGALVLRSAAGRVGLAASVLASAAAMLDSTVAGIALPHIGEEFGAEVSDLQWVVNGYLLTLASLILLGGALGDRFGRRRVFVLGALWFALASVACGLAPDIGWLVAARMAQGVGAALVTPVSLALLQSSFVPDDRAPAVGAWSGLSGIAGAVGPFVGGWLVDGPGWRWAFLVNVPVLGLAVVASKVFPETRDPAADAGFDVAGAVLAVAALAPLTWALTRLGGSDPPVGAIAAAASIGVVAGIAFVVRQRSAVRPLVPPSLFESRLFTVLNVQTFVLYAALGVVFVLVVFQLQVSAGWSALGAGAALLPATVLMLIGSERSGALAARIGPRIQLVAGPLLVAVGLVMLAGVDSDASWLRDVFPGASVFGLGLVTFVAPLTASVMGSVAESHVSTASGVNNAVARTGGLLAIAVVPAVAGLGTAEGATATTDAYRTAIWITAGLAVVASGIAAVGLPRCRAPRGARRFLSGVDGAPLQPDPRECRVDVPA